MTPRPSGPTTPLTIPGKVVLFDYGEVISVTPSARDRSELLTIAGVDAEGDELFWRSYWRRRDELDQGAVSTAAYWRGIGADLGVDWPVATLQRLWTADIRGWLEVDPGTVDLIAALHAGGTRLALLSNAGADYGTPFRLSPLGGLFERVFISAEMRALKPDPAIYLRVAADLGVTPADLVFIDNKAANTRAAAELGAIVHHFVGVDGLRAFLVGLAG